MTLGGSVGSVSWNYSAWVTQSHWQFIPYYSSASIVWRCTWKRNWTSSWGTSVQRRFDWNSPGRHSIRNVSVIKEPIIDSICRVRLIDVILVAVDFRTLNWNGIVFCHCCKLLLHYLFLAAAVVATELPATVALHHAARSRRLFSIGYAGKIKNWKNLLFMSMQQSELNVRLHSLELTDVDLLLLLDLFLPLDCRRLPSTTSTDSRSLSVIVTWFLSAIVQQLCESTKNDGAGQRIIQISLPQPWPS